MEHRAPSFRVAAASTSSNVRRRSSGAIAFNRHAKEDLFPSSYSQPSITVVSRDESNGSQSPHTLSLGPSYKSRRSSGGRVVHDSGACHVDSSVDIPEGIASGENNLVPSRQPSSENSDLFANLDNSVISSDLPPPFPYAQPPFMIRFPKTGLDSSPDFQASGTTYVGLSVESGHSGFTRVLRITDKFTKKWPAPRNFKNSEFQHEEGKPGAVAAPALEKGQGLGLTIAKWTVFKWCLLLSVMTVFAAGCAGLLTAFMTWSNTWQNSQVMAVADYDILIFITLAGASLLFTSMFGIVGTLLNSRPILAVYSLLLWPSMLSVLAVGYSSYRRASFSLDHKLSFSWSRFYTPLGRRVIQDSLQCCGFFSSMHEISPSNQCYLRTPLPGCRAKLFDFERDNLRAVWKAAFSLAPLHLINIVVALLCSNHITKTFGKGIFPRQYRLTPEDVKADADRFLSRNGAEISGTTVFEGVGVVHEKEAVAEKP